MRVIITKPLGGVDGWKEIEKNLLIKKISEEKFYVYDEIRYGNKNQHLDIFHDVIDLSDYDTDDIESEIEDEHKSFDELKNSEGDDWRERATLIIARNRVKWLHL